MKKFNEFIKEGVFDRLMGIKDEGQRRTDPNDPDFDGYDYSHLPSNQRHKAPYIMKAIDDSL